MEPITICMLGEFSLTAGSCRICDADTRSRRVWSLLAYLIHHRGQAVPQQTLMNLLWGEDSDAANPENALRITLHRLRTLLNQLWPGAGRELILSRDGCCSWNAAAPITLDSHRFEELCRSGETEDTLRLKQLQEALALYRGPFLPRQSSDLWTVGVSAHYANLFLSAAMEAAGLLSRQNRHREAADLCRSACAADPYHEPLHQLLMKELSAAGEPKAAAAVYETLCRRLFDGFGIHPSDETRAVYRSAACIPEDRALPMDEILAHLQEPEGRQGALQCDYDYFKVLCHAESRAMERRGNETHIALLRLGNEEKPLTRRTLRRIMEQFGDVLRTNLRRGDIISRCSTSQYVLLLSNANYENSCMVCRRVIAAYRQQHPHVSVRIDYLVRPLTPNLPVP